MKKETEVYLFDAQKFMEDEVNKNIGKCLGTCKHCGKQFFGTATDDEADKAIADLLLHIDSHTGNDSGKKMLEAFRNSKPEEMDEFVLNTLRSQDPKKFIPYLTKVAKE
jgi:hypothetical protein